MGAGDSSTGRHIIMFLGVFATCVYTSFVLSNHNITLVTGVVVAAGLFAFSFLSPRIALYLLIFSMLLSPEFGSRDYSGKGFTIRFEDVLLLIMGFAWLAKSAVFKNTGLFPRTSLIKPIIFYTIACVISTGLGIIRSDVNSPLTGMLFVLKYFEFFVIFFLTVSSTHSKDELRKFLWAIFITYIIVLVMGLIQIPRGQRISTPFEGNSSEPNTLGGYLLIMFSLTIMLLFNVTDKIQKTAIALLGALCLVAILYTLSRATWLGFVPMYLALILFTRKRNVLIAAFFVGMALFPILLPKAIINRFAYTFNGDIPRSISLMDLKKLKDLKNLKGFEDLNPNSISRNINVKFDSSTQARLNSMKTAVRDFQKKPIFGYGVTGYEFVDAQYHRVLVETGLVGFFAFIVLFWSVGSMVLGIWRTYRDDPLYNIITTGTFCSLIGLLFHAIGTNTFIIVRIMEPFWCLVGLCVAIPIIENQSSGQYLKNDISG